MTNYSDKNRLRVRRAKQNITNFNRIASHYFDSRPYEVVTEFDPHFSNEKAWATIKLKMRKKMPPTLNFVFAECIHNLRSVVDNILWQLGQLQNPALSDGIYFPVCMKPDGFPGRRNETLQKLPKAAYELVEQLQPYHKTDPQEHLLWILNRIWNDDKHRSPALVSVISSDTTLDFSSGNFEGAGVASWTYMPLRGDAELAGFPVPHDQLDFEPKLQLCYEVMLDYNGQVGEGRNACELLIELHNFVRDEVVNKFEPFF